MGRNILREIIAPLSVVLIVLGALSFLMGTIWIWFSNVEIWVLSNIVESLNNWNYYLFVIGIVLLITGVWYSYDFFRKRKFLLEEIKTDRRSELIKRKAELEDIVKRLPKKYERMLEDKKRELKIK